MEWEYGYLHLWLIWPDSCSVLPCVFKETWDTQKFNEPTNLIFVCQESMICHVVHWNISFFSCLVKSKMRVAIMISGMRHKHGFRHPLYFVIYLTVHRCCRSALYEPYLIDFGLTVETSINRFLWIVLHVSVLYFCLVWAGVGVVNTGKESSAQRSGHVVAWLRLVVWFWTPGGDIHNRRLTWSDLRSQQMSSFWGYRFS